MSGTKRIYSGRKRLSGCRNTFGSRSLGLLRGAASLACTWCKRGLDRLSDCAGTLSSDFCRINGAVPGRRFPSPLSGTPSLYAWVGLRGSAHVETLAHDILDRCDTGAWPDRHTVACPAILLTMRYNPFYPDYRRHCAPMAPICWKLGDSRSRCEEHDLCGLSDHG